jgi:hypothetical protein
MSKDYSKGYEQGQKDGASGNNRLAMRAAQRLLHVGAYLPGFGARDDEFIEGYKTGFQDKLRVIQTSQKENTMPETLGRGGITDESRIERESKHPHENQQAAGKLGGTQPPFADIKERVQTATASILTGGSPMSNSFAHQKELLLNLKQYLSQFQERLLGVSGSYQSTLDELHSAGMMDETYARYVQNELAQTQTLISRLVEHIGATDIPRVEKEISFLESH